MASAVRALALERFLKFILNHLIVTLWPPLPQAGFVGESFFFLPQLLLQCLYLHCAGN